MTRVAVTEESGAPAGFSAAVRQLQRAQKSSRGAPAYSLYVNRPLGRVLAAAAYGLRLTPNQVTAISAVFTFAGLAVLAIAPAEPWIGLLVAALLVLGYALDSADGQLARLTGGGSLSGEWLDHTVDSVKVVAFHLAVLVTLYRNFDLGRTWLSGAAGLRGRIIGALLRHDPHRPHPAGPLGRRTGCRRGRPGALPGQLAPQDSHGLWRPLPGHAAARVPRSVLRALHRPRGGDGRLHRARARQVATRYCPPRSAEVVT